jgi:NAD(P)-dependent dehydrogenase (short-subunit alcohol dehydrogenase family)
MTILITGANRGIGLALAETYGAVTPVIGTHRGPPPSGGDKIEWQELVVDDVQSHHALAARVKDRPIELLVCNAGVYLEKADEYEAELWAKTFAVNVTGVFLTINALMPNLRAGQGKIAIISSAMASDKRAPGGSYIYRASKAAALNLGRNLATDLKGELIPVGIYHPGWVQTDMGGAEADIDTQQSADGLIKRFSALSIATTGCFESYDGTQLAF